MSIDRLVSVAVVRMSNPNMVAVRVNTVIIGNQFDHSCSRCENWIIERPAVILTFVSL